MESSVALITMFNTDNQAIPKNWKQNPEIMRTILSMQASLDLGVLYAGKIDAAHEGGSPAIDERIQRLSDFLVKLQAKEGMGIGEAGKPTL